MLPKGQVPRRLRVTIWPVKEKLAVLGLPPPLPPTLGLPSFSVALLHPPPVLGLPFLCGTPPPTPPAPWDSPLSLGHSPILPQPRQPSVLTVRVFVVLLSFERFRSQ